MCKEKSSPPRSKPGFRASQVCPPPHRPALSPFRGWRLEERTGLRIQGVAGWGSSRVSLRYSLLALVPRSLPHPISLPACPHS